MVSIRKTKSALKFDTPASWWASTWREALPAGNGIVGAAVYGGAGDDTIMLGHNSLSWQGYVGVLPDICDKLKDVRRKLDDADYKAAESIFPNAMISKNYRPQVAVPLPMCDFKVKMPLKKPPVKDYMRVINMENGEVSVVYRDGSTKYDRSMFVSRANDCIVYEINKVGNETINVEFSFDVHGKMNNRTPNAVSKLPEGIMTKYEGYFMYFSGRDENGADYGAVARISYYGGSQQVTNKSIKVTGANNVLVMIKLFVNSQREKEWKELKTQLAANKSNYDKMLKEHTLIHSKLFNSIELDLDADGRDLSVEQLLKDTRDDEISEAMIEKLWEYGRYLFICATRADGQMIQPNGLWCGDFKAVNPKASADGVLQLMYNHAFAGGYEDFVLSVFNYYEGVMDDLKKNATRIYGCRGIFIPSITSPEMGLPGSVDPAVIHFTGAAGWISQMYYDYYLYTDDKKFLKERALPFMKETALFYEDFMKLDDNGFYVSSPSYSPGTTPGNLVEEDESVKTSICKNAAVDFAILKELLTNLIEGSQICNVNKNDIAKWKDMLKKVPEYVINEEGAVSEYIGKKFTDNFNSPMAAHLYPVYPGYEMMGSPNTDLLKAFYNAAKKRYTNGLSSQTSWSIMNLANIFACLGDGNSALDALDCVVKCMAMNNLVFAENDWRGMGVGTYQFWAPYQITANLALTSAVQNMLISSKPGVIRILPALPDDLKKGSVKGIGTRTGAEAAVSWDYKKGVITVAVKAKRASKVDLVFPTGTKKIAKGPGAETFNPETFTLSGVDLPAGKAITFEARI